MTTKDNLEFNRIQFKKYPSFKGGYRFKNFTPRITEQAVEVPLSQKIVLRLRQGFGDELPLLVKKGDKVQAGQIIARDDNAVSTPIISSVSGTIGDTVQITQGNKTANAIEIISSITTQITSVPRPDKDPLTFSHEEIGSILYHAGVTANGRSGIPTAHRSSVIEPKEVKEVIINIISTRPFAFPSWYILDNQSKAFVNGLRVVKRLYPQARINITIDRKKLKKMQSILKQENFNEEVTIHLLSNKYPQEQEEVLLETLFNLKIPEGQMAINLGVLILEAEDLPPIADAVFEGKPLLKRLVFVGGSGCEQKDNIYNVTIGTPASDFIPIKKSASVRVISGSVLNGRQWETLYWPTTRFTSSLAILIEGNEREFLSFLWPGRDRDSFSKTYLSALLPFFRKKSDTNVHGELRPCIICNYCEEVCPKQIIPHLLYKQVTHDLLEEAVRFQITKCIDCGLCTYVCPSKIELASTIKEAQQKVYGE